MNTNDHTTSTPSVPSYRNENDAMRACQLLADALHACNAAEGRFAYGGGVETPYALTRRALHVAVTYVVGDEDAASEVLDLLDEMGEPVVECIAEMWARVEHSLGVNPTADDHDEHEPDEPMYGDVFVTLEDGNVFAVLGDVAQAIRVTHGLDAASRFIDEATALHSYDEVLDCVRRTVHVTIGEHASVGVVMNIDYDDDDEHDDDEHERRPLVEQRGETSIHVGCGGEVKFTAYYGAPGIGQAWQCERCSEAFSLVGGTFHRASDGPFELSPGDVR